MSLALNDLIPYVGDLKVTVQKEIYRPVHRDEGGQYLDELLCW